MGEININILRSNGDMFSVESNVAASKVADFKELLAEKSSIPVDQQRLFYRGMVLNDDQTLDTYGLKAGHTVHLIDQKDVLEFAKNSPFAETETTPPSNSYPLPIAGAKAPNAFVLDTRMRHLLYLTISEMTQFMFSRPHLLDQNIWENRKLLSIFRCEPQLKEIMQNPEVVTQITSPQMMQQIISLPQHLPELNFPLSTDQLPEVLDVDEFGTQVVNKQDCKAKRNLEVLVDALNNSYYENEFEYNHQDRFQDGGFGEDQSCMPLNIPL